MIAHFSIPARDTRATAELFGKIIDGDVGTGALIGAAGGALCDDAGVCQSRGY